MFFGTSAVSAGAAGEAMTGHPFLSGQRAGRGRLLTVTNAFAANKFVSVYRANMFVTLGA